MPTTCSAGANFRASILAEHPSFPADSLGDAAWGRLERLAQASPLYAQVIRRDPSVCRWLEEDRNLRTAYRQRALVEEWRAFAALAGPELANEDLYVGRLRQWRRRMSLRIAYRSVNGFADEPATVAELSQLADFCLKDCTRIALRRWTERLGHPWDERQGRPARFCALALGKLGGEELNFSSDIDLIYIYEGEGHCRREGAAGPVVNAEFFTKFAETLTRLLTESTSDGFLFRVDVRLRPDGAWGQLVHPLNAIENYYATAGQTWERLALLKARPVAGDLALGAELLEDLHAFRYPRRPPLALLSEVAAMKSRTERELVRGALQGDLKRGPGGIREIEFIAQSLQLLHAGRNPFLQTGSTAAALERLSRYELVRPGDARFLTEAYWHLRRVEHRLQMRDERQTHELPSDEHELAAVAASLGFDSAAAFLADLDRCRRRVQALYAALFADRSVDRDFEEWWEFFTTDKIPPPVAARLERWFGADPLAAESLRVFACGDHRRQITSELVTRFQHLALHLDGLIPELARPLKTLARLARCAERYGTRQQFLNQCASNPQLLRVLGLLCDRSSYSAELLSAHPEILEEVLRPEMLRRRKLAGDLAQEVSAGPRADRPEFPAWLWLYARAEQMRYLIGELLGFMTAPQVEASLTALADAILGRLAQDTELLVVALGKYGGGELTFGSDLDLLIVSPEWAAGAATAQLEGLRRVLRHGGPLGPVFAADFRLRPHGDAGPLVTTLPALAAYHRGEAQPWEKQLLTRARVVAGSAPLAALFSEWIERLLYSAPPSPEEEASMWAMRTRVERERDVVAPPERAFKTGAGGLIDAEFLAQVLQLRHGHAHPALRRNSTREVLHALASEGLLPAEDEGILLGNYEFLKRIEFALRRDVNQGISTLPAEPADRAPLAHWLGFPDEASFWEDHTRRMHETRRLVDRLRLP
jgi:glutamate-ammonia-ligase adenylyltransferase